MYFNLAEENKVAGGENGSPLMDQHVCNVEANPKPGTAAAEHGKIEPESKEEKHASVTATITAPNKPAKRRITPMAIE